LPHKQFFNKILVANRGEIAVRIIRTCREMGIPTLAVYSEVDRNALHVQTANEAALLGPPPPLESYLNIDRIIQIAHERGADAIHPGYGFLAENPGFAKRCEKEEITFIGPGSQAIELLGNKIESRRVMLDAGIPCTPGFEIKGMNIDEIKADAERVGYPVLIKAAAGGGGKGMRIVREPEELEKSIEGAMRESKSAFADDTVYLEKYVEKPRHIEFQILADKHGNIIHLCERECSIQRRHQKVVEETPSTVLTPEVRDEMGKTAVRVAQASGYTNAGTVEFLYAGEGKYYFLEVNTRLQVEHPVTEEVYGVDLVVEQINLALGKPLSLRQEDLVPRGHAIECRIYAEDPLRNFAPSPGRINLYVRPAGPGVRVDSGVIADSVVPLDYDPMLAKLVVWAPDREAAVRRLKRALSEYQVSGVSTTLTLFRALVEMTAFRDADFHTGFLDQLLASGGLAELHGRQDPEAEIAATIAAACLATTEAGGLPDDLFAYGEDSAWWNDGVRVAHGRFPR